ncbi:MAG: hypothetical protein GC131_00090 [Alphaproteobacteria bacterium]|nr:hypothetical protein [Alphaproteobacteria bacterium]
MIKYLGALMVAGMFLFGATALTAPVSAQAEEHEMEATESAAEPATETATPTEEATTEAGAGEEAAPADDHTTDMEESVGE